MRFLVNTSSGLSRPQLPTEAGPGRRRRVGTSWTLVLLLLFSLGAWSGCKPDRSVREWLVEANRLVIGGETEDAREIYERLYADNPDHINVVLDLAAFYVDNQELDAAAPLVDRLRSMELGANDARRRETVERNYLETVYELSRGEGPAAPLDEVAYEGALRGLINISRGRSGTELEEYVTFLLIRARRAVGSPDLSRLDADNPEGLVRQADAAQAREAMSYIVRLFGEDEGLEVRPILDPDIRRELEAARAVLEKTIFFDDFDRHWDEQMRRFVNEGRFDANTEHFVVHYVGPLMDDLSMETPIETLRGRAETWYAREIATDLVYELRGLERGEGAPLPYRLDDFADATVQSVMVTPASEIDFTVGIPLSTVRKGAWLLEERVRSERSVTDLDEEDASEDTP